MTNEQAKQEAIKTAYEKCGYAEILPLNVNGWIKVKPGQYDVPIFERLKINSNTHSIRPKSLKYLDNNNGWIRIEPDGSNLPKKNDFVRWFNIENNLKDDLVMGNSKDWFLRTFSHYKPIKEDPKPVY